MIMLRYLAVAAAALLTGVVHAQTLTFNYSGTLYGVDPEFGSLFHEGDSFSGSYTFSSTASDVFPEDLSNSRYFLDSSSIAVNGITGESWQSLIQIYTNFPTVYAYQAQGSITSFAGHEGLWIAGLLDIGPLVERSDGLLLTPPSLSPGSATWTFIASDGPRLYGTILSWTSVTAIPEPETYAMLFAGLGLLGFEARRRKLKEAAIA
jgi:hypothetical protein